MARGGKRPGAGRKPKPRTEPEQPKLKPWRPTKYDPAFCDMVIEAMRGGYSLTGFAGQIGVARSTIGEWMSEFPDFSAACSIGKAARTGHWEGQAVKVGERGGGPGTAQMITFMLKNNAPDEYRDKVAHEHSGPDGAPIQSHSTVRPDLSGLSVDQLRTIEGILSGDPKSG
jgi:transposase